MFTVKNKLMERSFSQSPSVGLCIYFVACVLKGSCKFNLLHDYVDLYRDAMPSFSFLLSSLYPKVQMRLKLRACCEW